MPASSALADVPAKLHFVFDVDGTIVQGIPGQNRDLFDAKDLFTVDSGSNRNYVVYPGAREAITLLHAKYPDAKFSFAGISEPDRMDDLLSKLLLADAGKQALKSLATATLTQNDAKDLYPRAGGVKPPWDANLRYEVSLERLADATVYVTAWPDRVRAGDKPLVLGAGDTYFAFPSFEKAKAEDGRAAKDRDHYRSLGRYFPKDADHWREERFKWPRLYLAITEALADPKVKDEAQFRAALLALYRATASQARIDYGLRLLAGKGRYGASWKIAAAADGSRKITGCAKFDYQTAQEALVYDSNEPCLKELPTEKRWTFVDEKQARVSGCVVVDRASGLTAAKADLAACAKELPVLALWVGNARRQCFQYTTDERAFVQALAAASCGDQYLVDDAEKGQRHVVKGFDGFEAMSWAEVLQYVRIPPPDRSHLDRLWFPYDVNPKIGFTLRDCRDPSTGHTLRVGADGQPLPQCRPDTIYSWGPSEKVTDLRNRMGSGAWEASFRALFSTRSPIASHGYGPIPVRLKIREDARWKRSDDGYSACKNADDAERRNTVYFRADRQPKALLDIVICSPYVLESWSWGLREQYDEIVKEYRWLKRPDCTPEDCDLYEDADQNPFDMDWDGHSFSEATFLASLAGLEQIAYDQTGELFCNPTLPKAYCTKARHFATKAPIYYNEH